MILGTWHLTANQINYPTITFSNGDATLTSKGDTIYRYKYYLQNNDIIFVDVYNNKFKSHIKKISKDTLIFNSLLANKSIQVYEKIKNTKKS